jgi:D-alanine-D-alanine ligase-like ATP-grasp enzyme
MRLPLTAEPCVGERDVTVLRESWRLHPLSWIHRAEARSIGEELRHAGYAVKLERYRSDSVTNLPSGPLLLSVSDPVMRAAVKALTCVGTQYLGPGAAVMERCYDKYEAYCSATANGVDCPATTLANEASVIPFPLVLKPRRGSDSIGVRILRSGPIPTSLRTNDYIAQQYVHGAELTVAVLHERAGMPLRILLPEGTPYSFFRKYLLRPPREPLAGAGLAERVRRTALRIAGIFGVNWAARIDLIHETATDRLCFLECDVVPLIGAHSAFAASLEAAGFRRAEQLRLLLTKVADKP